MCFGVVLYFFLHKISKFRVVFNLTKTVTGNNKANFIDGVHRMSEDLRRWLFLTLCHPGHPWSPCNKLVTCLFMNLALNFNFMYSII